MRKNLRMSKKSSTFAPAFEESCLSGRKSRTRNAVYALRRIGGSNPSLSAKRRVRETEQDAKENESFRSHFFVDYSGR